VVEGQRKFMGTLWNTYAFFVLYANIDEFDATKYTLDATKLGVMDRWLLSRLNTTVAAVDDNLANYRIPEAARALQEFVDEMSNWYVRRGRERFWAPGMEEDKINAYMTLYTALVTIAKTAAPMIPFMTEDIYRNLVCSIDKDAPESVHLCDFPEVDTALIDKQLEADMDEVLKVVVLGRAARNGSNRKNRQPLSVMYVQAGHQPDEDCVSIIRDELNLKAVEFTADTAGFVSYRFKPQLKTLGPKYGKQLGAIREALANLDGSAAKAQLDATGTLTLALPEGDIALTAEDLLIETEQKEGFFTLTENGITVALDTTLTPELIEEGHLRELISKLQTMRKEAGFDVTDRITITAEAAGEMGDLIARSADELCAAVLADSLTMAAPAEGAYAKEWDINGEAVTLGVKRV
ncbi:MAG: class I tRNA ligase family protein, partial [Clostridia bacterium]|nr:class I tRNA ligase family protein [Clostridia bacterium]